MKECQKSACSFENWYPKLRKWSIRAEFEMVPDDVLEFLRSDGVTVPVEAAIRRKKTSYVDDITFKEWDSEEDGDSDDEMPQPTFPGFSSKLSESLERFGGNVFIKLNWSAPTDAAWIATNSSLKCSNLQDIYLLLKGSNKISTDLDTVSGSSKFFVVLKEWQDIHPGSEFRCFISNKELIAVSQRNSSEFHLHIQQNVCTIVSGINDFYRSNVKNVFPLNNYTLDVIWSPGSIKIVDFNTFGDESVNPGLFSWSELEEMDYIEGVSPEFRYISEDIGIQPVRLSQHFGLPIDLTEISQEKSQSIIDILQAQVDIQRADE
uniref:Uncharacterized protein n=1 Tax=Lygus hesperus TaxID=30085 RepID=A0A0K8SUY7_LYGHE